MGPGFLIFGAHPGMLYAHCEPRRREMALKFPGDWRFTPPADGQFFNKEMPDPAVWDFMDLIEKIRTKHSRWTIFEHFKRAFGGISRSSSEDWAYTDLMTALRRGAENAPLFIECVYDGCNQLRDDKDGYVPDTTIMNAILERHNVGYVIQAGELVPRERATPPIEVTQPPPTLSDRARETLDGSLKRSEELLRENRPREAVQAILWLLETITTAFRGVETETGRVEGKYFNRIVQDLRNQGARPTLQRILDWITAMHGYLSAPAGGGVRHGTDLDQGVEIDANEARLFCNLTRSYISFLIVEHEALMRPKK